MANEPTDDFVVTSNVPEREPAPAQETPAPVVEAALQAEADKGESAVAPEPESEPAKPDDAAASEAGKTLAARKKSAQQRIDELTWEREEARREVARLRQEFERRLHTTDPPAGSSPAEAAAPAPTRPKPALDQFSTADDPYAAWLEAVADWKAEQRFAELEAKRQQAEQRQREDAAQEAHVARERAYLAAHPDYETVIAQSTAPVSQAMRAAILQSERGPEIMYHLATHSEVAADLARETASVGPASVGLVRRLLESRLDPAPSGSGSSAPSVTAAKPPIRPVGSSPVVAAEGPPDDSADLDAHVQYYNRLEREARRR